MKILLDTCALIWLTSNPKQLSKKARTLLSDHNNEILISDVTALEITLKHTAGKIRLPQPPKIWLEKQLATWEIQTLPLERTIIYRTAELPLHHADPFDRLLIAAAIFYELSILTPDKLIWSYPVAVYW